MCYEALISTVQRAWKLDYTYPYQEIGIATVEIGNLQHTRQRVLRCEWSVELRPKLLLHTQRLQDEDARPHDTLLGRIVLAVDGVEEDQDDEVASALGVDQIAAEALVALQQLPEQR